MAQPGPDFGRTGLAHRVGPILPPLSKTKRIIKPPVRYGFEELAGYALTIVETVDVHEPTSFSEAMTSKDLANWHAAMKEEIHGSKSRYRSPT